MEQTTLSIPKTRKITLMQTKHCPHCGQIKPISQFNSNKTRYDGLQAWCRECQNHTKRKMPNMADNNTLQQELIMETRKEITITIELITPEKASEYLKHNSLNRHLSDSWIEVLAKEMIKGSWRENLGEPICFAYDGTLINGQHRLQAVIKAGVAVRMTVVRGADPKDFEVMDTGKKRTGGDILSIVGTKNANTIASIIKTYLQLKKNRQRNSHTTGAQYIGITNKITLDEYYSSPDLYKVALDMANYVYRAGRFLMKAETGGIYVYLIKEKHHSIEEVDTFFAELADGGLKLALSDLRKRLIRSVTSKRKVDKLDMDSRRVLISKAWNLYIKGEDQKSILCRKGDKYSFD